MKEILFTKEKSFYDCENEDRLFREQAKYLQALETLGFKYVIERTSTYATNVPTWKVTVYKR